MLDQFIKVFQGLDRRGEEVTRATSNDEIGRRQWFLVLVICRVGIISGHGSGCGWRTLADDGVQTVKQYTCQSKAYE